MTPVAPELGTVARICVLDTIVNGAATVWNFTPVVPANPVPVIVTTVPTGPLAGVNPLIVGLTRKPVPLVAVPDGVVTVIFPVTASGGTVAVILAYETTVNVDGVPLNRTSVVPVKALPVIVTTVPTVAAVGVNPLIAGTTTNGLGLVAVPAGVVTTIGPVVAPEGTVVVICVGDTTVKDALVPPNVTAEAPENPVPEIETVVPTAPLPGETDVIVTDGVTESWAVPLALPSVPVTV